MSLHPSVRSPLDGWIALFVYKHKLGTLAEIPRGTKANLILYFDIINVLLIPSALRVMASLTRAQVEIFKNRLYIRLICAFILLPTDHSPK